MKKNRPDLETVLKNVDADTSLSESEKKIVREKIKREYERKQSRGGGSGRKVLLIVLAAAVAVILLLLLALGVVVLIRHFRQTAQDQKETELDIVSYNFCTPDYSENIYLDSYYMNELDRTVYFTDDDWGTTLSVTEDLIGADREIAFLYTWIQYIIDGKYQEYNQSFTDRYLLENGKIDRFTQQKLYEIEIIKPVSEGEIIQKTYRICFKIYQNNGTYTTKVGSDMTLTMDLTLAESGGSYLISSLAVIKKEIIHQK